ncbi:MAG TPA: hypothetical protein VFA72_05860 [Burkholderiales bacterium]|nr:hypothetical protein [Burkholderiales bacterium]
MPLEHWQHEERHDVITEISGEVTDAQPPLRILRIAKCSARGTRRLDALAEGRMPDEELGVRNALRAGEGEKLG